MTDFSTIRPSTSTLQVRALNHGVPGPWRTLPFVVTYCGDMSKSLALDSIEDNNLSKSQQQFIDERSDGKEIQIFPNPARDFVSIFLPDFEIIEIKLYDINGILRKETKPNGNSVMINTSDLEKGMYIVKIITKKGIETRKVQINK